MHRLRHVILYAKSSVIDDPIKIQIDGCIDQILPARVFIHRMISHFVPRICIQRKRKSIIHAREYYAMYLKSESIIHGFHSTEISTTIDHCRSFCERKDTIKRITRARATSHNRAIVQQIEHMTFQRQSCVSTGSNSRVTKKKKRNSHGCVENTFLHYVR